MELIKSKSFQKEILLNPIKKWIKGWKILVNMGEGWVNDYFTTSYPDLVYNRNAYSNQSIPFKIVQCKEINPEWVKNFGSKNKIFTNRLL